MWRVEVSLEVLRNLDWVRRHELLAMHREIDFSLYARLLSLLGPDEALLGANEAAPPDHLPQVLAPRPQQRQRTLPEMWARNVRARRGAQ